MSWAASDVMTVRRCVLRDVLAPEPAFVLVCSETRLSLPQPALVSPETGSRAMHQPSTMHKDMLSHSNRREDNGGHLI